MGTSISNSTSRSTGESNGAADRLTIGAAPPQPAFLNIEADFQQAYSTTDFAFDRASAAGAFINKLGDLAASLTPPTINPQFPINANAPTISTPLAPEIQDITFELPQAPNPFTGSVQVDVNFPTFDAQPPQLMFPNAPVPDSYVMPTKPTIDLNFTYPEVDVQLPSAPDLLSIDVRKFDGVTFPEFDAELPTLMLAQPQIVNYIPNAPYTDRLLSGMLDYLDDCIQGRKATGLAPSVEQNIWNRGREREYRQRADAILALDKMEEMGYSLPSGAYIDGRIKIETDMGATMVGLSRDVMIKQAELEQKNIEQALNTAATIEGKLIDYANQTEQRRFDACKYATEAGVSIYNAVVQSFTARIQGYRAQVDVYTAQIAAARGIVEVYTAEINAEKLKVDANTAIIQEYKTRVDAALASIEVFKGEVSIIQTRAQVENLKVSIFGEEIKAYAAQINVFTSEVEAYRSQITAEQTKEAIYGTQATAYGAIVDATAKGIGAKIDVFKAQLAAKEQEYTAFRTLVEAGAEKVKAIAAGNSSVADIYRAEVQGTSAYNDALVKEWEAINSLSIQITQVGVSAAQANGQLYLAAKGIATDAAKVGAQVEAQLGASALGAVTWATHRSRQDNVGANQSRSYGESKSLSQSSGSSTSDSTSHDPDTHFSNSFGISQSTSTSTVHQIQSVE